MWNYLKDAMAFPALYANELINGRPIQEDLFVPQEEPIPYITIPYINITMAAALALTLMTLGVTTWRWMRKKPESQPSSASLPKLIEAHSQVVEAPSIEGMGSAQKMPVQLICMAFKAKATSVNPEILPGLNAYTPLSDTYEARQKEILNHLQLPENGNITENTEHYRAICNRLNVPCSV